MSTCLHVDACSRLESLVGWIKSHILLVPTPVKLKEKTNQHPSMLTQGYVYERGKEGSRKVTATLACYTDFLGLVAQSFLDYKGRLGTDKHKERLCSSTATTKNRHEEKEESVVNTETLPSVTDILIPGTYRGREQGADQETWQCSNVEEIARKLKTCGISNALDSSKDDRYQTITNRHK